MQFKAENMIASGRLFAYLGGLDGSKRVDFLAATLDELHERGSDVHLMVGGAGKESFLLQEARDRGQVSALGYVQGSAKAAVLKSSIGIVNPGRVGLLAVDALVAGRPILTTDWKYHAPEIEYLEPGKSLFTSIDTAPAFAALIDDFRPLGNVDGGSAPTLDAMVKNFSKGIRAMLGG